MFTMNAHHNLPLLLSYPIAVGFLGKLWNNIKKLTPAKIIKGVGSVLKATGIPVISSVGSIAVGLATKKSSAITQGVSEILQPAVAQVNSALTDVGQRSVSGGIKDFFKSPVGIALLIGGGMLVVFFGIRTFKK